MIRATHKQPAIPVTGRVIAITGAARGIGRATAQALLAKSARVAIGDLDLDFAWATATDLGDDVIAIPLDVTDRTSLAAFLDETRGERVHRPRQQRHQRPMSHEYLATNPMVHPVVGVNVPLHVIAAGRR